MFGGWNRESERTQIYISSSCDEYGAADSDADSHPDRGTIAHSAPGRYCCSLRCEYPYPTADTDN